MLPSCLILGAAGKLNRVPLTVLIVDDHDGFRRVARQLLETDGYDVVAESATGGDALETVNRVRPSVVLLDIGLPDMNGIDVADRLKHGDTPPAVVLTSSRDGRDYASLISSCGARGFIPKAQLSGLALNGLLAA